MSIEQEIPGTIHIEASNIGGIDRTNLDFKQGVNVLSGRNATNRTSLLQAIMATMGSEQVSLKGDADEGEASLTIADETFSRTLTRENGDVAFGGDPYLEDSTVADLFAFLLRTNEARQAVVGRENLRDLVMRPIDTEEIRERIETLQEERREVEDRLEELDSLEDRLPALEREYEELQADIEEKRAELEEKNEQIEDADRSIEESQAERKALEEKLNELQSVRSDLQSARSGLRTDRESLESLQEQHEELIEEREELPETSADRGDELQGELERLRQRKRGLDTEIDRLQSIIEFNQDQLSAAKEGSLNEAFLSEEQSGSVTDQLVEGSTRVRCWTCGSDVETDQLEATVESLTELRRNKFQEASSIDEEIDELSAELREIEEHQQRRETIDRRIESIEEEISEREDRVSEREERVEDLADEIESLEEDVEDLENEDYQELLELHNEANRIEFEIQQLEEELSDMESEIETVKEDLERRSDVEAEKDDVQAELADLRTRIEEIEQDAVDRFNDHMETLLEVLSYENIERIWLESTQREVRDGRRKVEKTFFNLHIVRQSDSGRIYEDTVNHLSDSEREVMGLVFALAGYLVHDVHEILPFMLLDSLEAIDSDRLALLIDYFEDFPQYLVVALLPEDAQALDDSYHYIESI